MRDDGVLAKRTPQRVSVPLTTKQPPVPLHPTHILHEEVPAIRLVEVDHGLERVVVHEAGIGDVGVQAPVVVKAQQQGVVHEESRKVAAHVPGRVGLVGEVELFGLVKRLLEAHSPVHLSYFPISIQFPLLSIKTCPLALPVVLGSAVHHARLDSRLPGLLRRRAVDVVRHAPVLPRDPAEEHGGAGQALHGADEMLVKILIVDDNVCDKVERDESGEDVELIVRQYSNQEASSGSSHLAHTRPQQIREQSYMGSWRGY